MKFGIFFIWDSEWFYLNNSLIIISREKQKALRNIRSLEKRLRDATTIAEETQKQANNYKEQVKKYFCRI